MLCCNICKHLARFTLLANVRFKMCFAPSHTKTAADLLTSNLVSRKGHSTQQNLYDYIVTMLKPRTVEVQEMPIARDWLCNHDSTATVGTQ